MEDKKETGKFNLISIIAFTVFMVMVILLFKEVVVTECAREGRCTLGMIKGLFILFGGTFCVYKVYPREFRNVFNIGGDREKSKEDKNV